MDKKKLVLLFASLTIGAFTTALHSFSQIEKGKNMCSDLVVQSELKVFRNPKYQEGTIKFITCRDYVNKYPLFSIKTFIINSLFFQVLISYLLYIKKIY